MAKESFIVMDYSTFYRIVKERAEFCRYIIEEDIDVVCEDVWSRLNDPDPHTNIQAIGFEDIYGDTLTFHALETGIRVTFNANPSKLTLFKYRIRLFWADLRKKWKNLP